MIPAAGFFYVVGVNLISWTAVAILTAIGLAAVVEALRPVIVVTRSGLVIRRRIGAGDLVLRWQDIEAVTAHSSVVSITACHVLSNTRSIYQLRLTGRAAAFIERTYQRILVSGRTCG